MKTKLQLIIMSLVLLFMAGRVYALRQTRGVIHQANLTASLAAALAAITTLILSTMPNSLPTWRIWSMMANTTKASISS